MHEKQAMRTRNFSVADRPRDADRPHDASCHL